MLNKAEYDCNKLEEYDCGCGDEDGSVETPAAAVKNGAMVSEKDHANSPVVEITRES